MCILLCLRQVDKDHYDLNFPSLESATGLLQPIAKRSREGGFALSYLWPTQSRPPQEHSLQADGLRTTVEAEHCHTVILTLACSISGPQKETRIIILEH